MNGTDIHSSRTMISLEEALKLVLDGAEGTGTETLPLAAAAERILSRDVRAEASLPPVPLSARDGYSFSSADSPGKLTVVGESRAGTEKPPSIRPGEAVRIFTGAPLPEGADTVLMQEYAVLDGEHLLLDGHCEEGAYVRPAGSDCSRGELLLEAGARITASAAAVLAGQGRSVVEVFRKPVVAYLVNGDELVDHHVKPCPAGKTRNVNALSLELLIRRCGCDPLYLGTFGDSEQELRTTLSNLPCCDVLLSAGGASVGDYDYIYGLALELGFDVAFSRIALKPGKPTIFARKGPLRFIGLPGNPVSCIVVFELLVRPLLSVLAGSSPHLPVSGRAILATDEKKEELRRYFLPGRLERRDDELPLARPEPRRESSAIVSLARSDVLIVLPEDCDFVPRGTEVQVIHLDA